jgi:hypothetical protein
MRRTLRWIAILMVVATGLIGLGVAAIAIRYGGGEPFPDLTTDPELPASALEVVADLASTRRRRRRFRWPNS